MVAELPRSTFQFDHDQFHTLFNLCIDRPWLRTQPRALTDLWQLCDSAEKKALIIELIERFEVLEAADIEANCAAIATHILGSWAASPKNTLVVAISDSAEADGSQMALQFLKQHFSAFDGWTEDNFRNSLRDYKSFLRSGKHFVLLDDFIGTGSTILKRVKKLKEYLAELAIEDFTISVVAIAGMSASRELLDLCECSYYSPLWLERGIDHFNDQSQANDKKRIMRLIEESLMRKFNGQWLPSLGYRGSQALYAIRGMNCPNNVFPVFWWPKYVDKSDRATIFRRLR